MPVCQRWGNAIGRCAALVLLLLTDLAAGAVHGRGTCASDDAAHFLQQHLFGLPQEELLLLGELVKVDHADASVAVLIQELACTSGAGRQLLLQALDELGHPLNLDATQVLPPQAPASSSATRRDARGGKATRGQTTTPFVYFLQIGAGGRVDGVSIILWCLLLASVTTGPVFSSDGGVVTCHRFGRYCESWFTYQVGTRIEAWLESDDNYMELGWLSGTVVESNVKSHHGGVLTGRHSHK